MRALVSLSYLFYEIQHSLIISYEFLSIFALAPNLLGYSQVYIVILVFKQLKRNANLCFYSGRLMRLTYFASPYQLLDIDNPGETLQFTRECKY